MHSSTSLFVTNEEPQKKNSALSVVLTIVKWIGIVLAMLIGIWSMRYWAGVRYILNWENQQDTENAQPWLRYPWALIIHATGGIIALMVGPWQFFPQIRDNYPKYHRCAGFLYFCGIFLGICGAYVLISVTSTGFAGGSGLFTLATLWWMTAGTAFYRIWKQHDFRSHREWMIRNYALTFAAVTLRIQLQILTAIFPFMDAYRGVMWTSWVPNAIIAELYINYTREHKL